MCLLWSKLRYINILFNSFFIWLLYVCMEDSILGFLNVNFLTFNARLIKSSRTWHTYGPEPYIEMNVFWSLKFWNSAKKETFTWLESKINSRVGCFVAWWIFIVFVVVGGRGRIDIFIYRFQFDWREIALDLQRLELEL